MSEPRFAGFWTKLYRSNALGRLVLGLGVLVRLRQYLANRSLRGDETLIALNLFDRDLAHVVQPLDYSQAAPPAFMALEKLCMQWFGPGEESLRLVPLISGIAALFLFSFVANRMLSRGLALVTTSLFALNAGLIYYSSELKPYSLDVLVCLLLFWGAISLHDRPARSVPVLLLLGLGAAATLWSSNPAVFVSAGAFAVLFLTALRRRTRDRWMALGIVGGLWAISAVGVWLFVVRPNAQLDLSVWADSFVPSIRHPIQLDEWLIQKFLELFQYPLCFGVEGVGIAAGAFLLATVREIRYGGRQRKVLSLLLVPGLLTLFAAYLHKYPFSERFLLFLTPLLLLVVGLGLSRFHSDTRGMLIPVTALFLMFLTPVETAAHRLIHPDQREEIRVVMTELEKLKRPDEILYVYRYAESGFRYYLSTRGDQFPKLKAAAPGDPRDRIPPGIDLSDTPTKRWVELAEDLKLLCGKRVWILASHVNSEEQWLMRVLLDSSGTHRKTISAPGAVAHLYDLRCDKQRDSEGAALEPSGPAR